MKISAWRIRWGLQGRVILVLSALLLNACSSTYTLGDLLSGGPSPLTGTPAESSLLLVDVQLLPPVGEMFSRPLSLYAEHPYLENIDTKEQLQYTDERWGYVMFSGVKPGRYRFIMPSFFSRTIYTKDQYKKHPEEHLQQYNYLAGDTWKTVITVEAGKAVYHGAIMIPPEFIKEFGIGFPVDSEEDKQPQPEITGVVIQHDAQREAKAWKTYFPGIYSDPVWTPVVNQHLSALN